MAESSADTPRACPVCGEGHSPAVHEAGSPEREAWERRHMDEVSRQDTERGEV